jgi:hypothetical protein
MPKKVGDSRQLAYSGISKRTDREQLDRQFRNLPRGKGEFARAIKELRLSKKNESKVSTRTAPLNEYEYRMTAHRIRRVIEGDPDKEAVSSILSIMGQDIFSDIPNKREEEVLTLLESFNDSQRFALMEAYQNTFGVDLIEDLDSNFKKMGLENSFSKRLEMISNTDRSEANKRVESTVTAMLAKPKNIHTVLMGYEKMMTFRSIDEQEETHKEIMSQLAEAGIEPTRNMGDDFDALVTHRIKDIGAQKLVDRQSSEGSLDTIGDKVGGVIDQAKKAAFNSSKWLASKADFVLPLTNRAFQEADKPFDSWTERAVSKFSQHSWQRNSVEQIRSGLNNSAYAKNDISLHLAASRLGYELQLAASQDVVTDADRTRLFKYVKNMFDQDEQRALEIIALHDREAEAKIGIVGRKSGYNTYNGAIAHLATRWGETPEAHWLLSRPLAVPQARNGYDTHYLQDKKHQYPLTVMLAAELEMVVDGKLAFADAANILTERNLQKYVSGTGQAADSESLAEMRANMLARYKIYTPIKEGIEATENIADSVDQNEIFFAHHLEERMPFEQRARIMQLLNGEGLTEAEEIYLAIKNYGFASPEVKELTAGKTSREVVNLVSSLERGEPEALLPEIEVGKIKDSLTNKISSWRKEDD